MRDVFLNTVFLLSHANIESSPVSDTSRINTAYHLGKLISSTGEKFLKPVTIQYLPAADHR